MVGADATGAIPDPAYGLLGHTERGEGDGLCCPLCHGGLERRSGGGALHCRTCRYRGRRIDNIDFLLPERDLSKVELWQQSVYDERVAVYLAWGQMLNLTLTYRVQSRWVRQLGWRTGERFLDIGCSNGTRLREIEFTYGARGFGIDISPQSIAHSRAHPQARTYVATADCLPFIGGYFDHIICLSVLEHLPDPMRALEEAYRCLRPGGTALYHVGVRDVGGSLDWWLASLTPRFWRRHMAEAGHSYEQMLTAADVLLAASRAGFEIVRQSRFDVLLQNYFDYYCNLGQRSLGLLFVRGVLWGGRRHPLPMRYYHRWVAPVIEALTWSDRVAANLGVGAGILLAVRKPSV